MSAMHLIRAMPRAIALVLLGAACAEQPVTPDAADPIAGAGGPARLTIYLTDDPGDIQTAMVTISEVYLQGRNGRTVLRDTPFPVNLVELATTSTILLEDVAVDAGTYNDLRFVITGGYLAVEQPGGGTQIYASSPDYAELPEDTPIDGELRLPSFATSGLKVKLPVGGLVVPTSGTVTLTADFDVAQSFGHVAGQSGAWVMHPVVEATGVSLGTTLAVAVGLGTGVTLPAGVTLGDFQATLALASAPGDVLATVDLSDVDGDGIYTAGFGAVAPGEYLVDFVVPGTVTAATFDPPVPYTFNAEAGPGVTLTFTVTAAS